LIVVRRAALSRSRNNRVLRATLQFRKKLRKPVGQGKTGFEEGDTCICRTRMSARVAYAKEREPKGIQYSVCIQHTTRSTGARVLTRIRPRVFAPYDASTVRSVVELRYTPERRRIGPASNYYDKLHAGETLSSPCKPGLFATIPFFINFNFAYALVSVATRSESGRANSCVLFLITAPVYDQNTTQVAEYDGGMYITSLFITFNHLVRLTVSYFMTIMRLVTYN